ncbi:hypothetical protein [Vibrio splendidus]|uniref:hypothetical protein n=1 Tax=Vibrio splendidus TaxID=29497 RepID=UPI001E299A1C|nr:hypothetical protein [Vibrio splendidus]MCC4860874.1 hypothetical protein [Vibrio splendidus]
MILYKNANKHYLLSVVFLLALFPIQIFLNASFVPSFAQNVNTQISKTVLTYGEQMGDKKYRKIDYHLKPYLWNRFLLLASIHFDNGKKLDTQFLITFWPKSIYSIKYINQLVNSPETEYFDLPEQHVLFDGGEENFQTLLETSHQYCYIQLSNSSVQCVNISKNKEKIDVNDKKTT